MTYVETIKRGNNKYYYLTKNLRVNSNTWKKIRIYIGDTKPTKLDIKKYAEQIEKRTQEEGIAVRDLLTRSPEDLAYAKKAKPGPRYEIRFVREGAKFLTDNAIFGESVVFFSFQPQIFAVMISSREISQAIKTLFEFAWQSADPYEKVIRD